MDPNELLDELLALAKTIQRELDETGNVPETPAEELADGFLNLHAWITSGGFLPEAWKAKR